MRLHNTLTGQIEDFEPINQPKVGMFVCGPTVYDYSHLGHAKTYTQFDVIARSLRYLGFDLNYVVNITDIDDKIIKRSLEKSVEPRELAKEYEQAYLEDMKALNNVSVDKYARALDYIPQIISQVKRLIEKDMAYKISDGYYFDTKKFEDYGKLSGRDNLKEGDAVSRIDENPEKRNPGDFCLWKFKKEDEPFWETEIGAGRPGWHIEDTAITETELGVQYDIHGGAIDLIFPHHEAEIAQMETISGKKPLVKYWLHTGFLNIKDEKMSKSLGNFTTIRDSMKLYRPLALRYFFLTSHYRSPMNFTDESLTQAQSAYRNLKEQFSTLPEGGSEVSNYKEEFKEALENDFNTPQALAVVWNLLKDENITPEDKRVTLKNFDKVLGLNLENNEFEVEEIPQEIQTLLSEREMARKENNYLKSDELRDKIKEKGFEVLDTSQGQELRKI